jgi:prolyl oligopeptidase
MKWVRRWLVIGLAAVAGPSIAAPNVVTPRRPVTHEYHGLKVTDDYEWLEDAKDPAVRAWTAEQNKQMRAYLDKLPVRAPLAEQLEELYEEASANYFALTYRTGLVFAMKFKPPAQQPVLVSLTSLRSLRTEKKAVDPNKLDTNGTTTIDWYVPSPNGKYVAVSLSKNGSEDGTLHFFETATGKELKDRIPRVQYPTGGGSAAWNANSSGIYYTRYPHKGERPEADLNFFQQVYFHQLGTPIASDVYQIGKDFPRIAEIVLTAREDGRYLLATVANGDGGDFAHYLRGPAGEWKQLTKFADGIKYAAFGRDDALYLLSRKKAPRGKVLRLPLHSPKLRNATELVKESEAVIENFVPTENGIYVEDLVGGPSQTRFFDRQGHFKQTVPIKKVSSVQQMLLRRGDELLFRNISYSEPYGWYLWEPGTNQPVKTALVGRSPVEFKDAEVVREFATSKDGTKVPLNILRKKGTKLDGNNPTLLYAYGGYGISLTPNFNAVRRLWLDAGGVYVIANLRGGGEFGEDWHKAGNLTKKQNVFDDFAACAEYLIKAGYTNPKKLAIEGGSNGGLLMGAMLTQHPEMVSAVVSHVGIYDMLRVELEPNGAFNVTEFGTVKDKAQFNALYAYSPFHRVKDGTDYPAVFLLTGENDGRVNPYNSRKMTARLQAATKSDRPVLLRTSASAGHGMGSALSERIASEADALAFLFDQLSMDLSAWISGTPIVRGPWSGAISTNSAMVKARLSKEGATARLVVSRSPQFTDPVYSAPARAQAEHFKIVALPVSGLLPDTAYHYALEIDGKLETDKRGEFRTFPAGPASFTFAYASCAKTGSTNSVFTTIRENQPLFYMNVGDFHYQNIGQNKPWKFRRAYDRVLGSLAQADLYRHVPLVYVWDDHDFGGDNSNRKASSHEAARALYEDYVPHYPLASGESDVPIYQSFAVGRAKFILTDLRSERDESKKKDDAHKSMMGAKQKEWFKKELLEADGKYPVIFWVSSVPWIGKAGTNYYQVKTNVFGYIHHTKITDDMRRPPRHRHSTVTDDDADEDPGEDDPEKMDDDAHDADADSHHEDAQGRRRHGPRFPFGEDYWSVFSTERREIADFITEHNIRGLCILHGDSHMLAADDGSHSDYATGGGAPIPVMCAAPLDQNPSLKGGPYSQGVYRVKKDEGCFGLVTVTDDGKEVSVSFSGRNNRNEEKIALSFKVPAK